MASRIVTVTLLLAFCLCLLQVEGSCRVKGKGKLITFNDNKAYVALPCKYHATTAFCQELTTFNDNKAYVALPCKYHATTTFCQGYKIHVAPGQAFDKKNRLYTRTVWISISKDEFGWKGRTTAKKVTRFFGQNATASPFQTKKDKLDGAPFQIEWSADIGDYSATMSVTDAEFEITYYGYVSSSTSIRKNNGIEIICPEPEYTDKSHYPVSICVIARFANVTGNITSGDPLRSRKRNLNVRSKTMAIIYDILSNEAVRQTNPQCAVARDVFRSCNGDKSQVVEKCSDILIDNITRKCLYNYGEDPMSVFVYCLTYYCTNDVESCDYMVTSMQDCPSLSGIPQDCPESLS